MLEESLKTPVKRLIAATLMAAVLSSCTQTQGWLDSVRGKDTAVADEQDLLGAPAADDYLAELSDAGAQLTPNPSTKLRYALVLATPGHPESDPQQAQSILRELMAQPALMTPAEVALATIYLKSTEELILLSSETRRLRASTDRAQRTEAAAVNQRLATVEAENRRLRRELEEAEDKLEAITSIERSIRAQDQ